MEIINDYSYLTTVITNQPTKMSKLIVSVVVAIIGGFCAVPGFAQSRGHVGVNLILKPIQTIHVESIRDQSNRAEEPRLGQKRQNQYVTVFGTTTYQLGVDSVAFINTLCPVDRILPHSVLASKDSAATYSRYGQNKRDVHPDSLSQALVIYSIQVK